jgi:phosphate transport system substrate-binding protein
VGIYVHRDNPIPRLTLEQVDAIFSTTRYRGFPHAIDRWGQLGLEDEWGSAPIKLYGRDEKSGTRGFIKEHVLRNGEFDPRVQEEPGAASVILALSRDPLGIGYSGIGLQTSSVRPVPLAEHADGPYIAPSVASVMDGSYPLRRTLYLYLDKSPTRALRPIVQEFLSFLNSRDGQEVVVKTGFYPLPVAQIERNVAALGPLAR